MVIIVRRRLFSPISTHTKSHLETISMTYSGVEMIWKGGEGGGAIAKGCEQNTKVHAQKIVGWISITYS